MQRIIAGRGATLYHTFFSGPTASDPSPDTATVEIIRANGDIVVPAGTSTTEAGVGRVSFTLTPAQVPQLDRLTFRWTATFGGQPQTFTEIVEVAGDIFFTINQARTLKPLDNLTLYPEERIIEMRTAAEQAIENELGYALVPRYEQETVSADGWTTSLELAYPYLRAVRSVVVAGTPYSPSELATIANSGAFLHLLRPWPRGHGTIVIGYEHGLDIGRLSGSLRLAALDLARHELIAHYGSESSGGIDPRAERLVTDDGTLIFGGAGGDPTPLPSVNRAITAHRLRYVA